MPMFIASLILRFCKLPCMPVSSISIFLGHIEESVIISRTLWSMLASAISCEEKHLEVHPLRSHGSSPTPESSTHTFH